MSVEEVILEFHEKSGAEKTLIQESKRGGAPLLKNSFPLSLEGEGD